MTSTLPTAPTSSLAAATAGAVPGIGASAAPENLAALTRPDFPLLAQTACLGQPLIYLDHAATKIGRAHV